jgi:hypothetical protein
MAHRAWRILVESRKDERHRDQLDLIATTLQENGYHVARWRGPLSGRVACSRRLLDCDLAILCNGTTDPYRPVLKHLKRAGIDTLFVELGWYPQSGTLQIDPDGINASASWVNEPLMQATKTPLSVRPSGDLLVLLQHEQDTQITCQSPHFSKMSTFLVHLAKHSALPLRVRSHPKFPIEDDVRQAATEFGIGWDCNPSLKDSLESCQAVACINSSGAVEALAERLPVLCFGHAIYRHPGAVYCLNRDGAEVAAVTQELAAGRCTLVTEKVDAIFRRILDQQWRRETIPLHLPKLVDDFLSRLEKPRTKGRVGWMDHVRATPTVLSTYLYPKFRRAG